MVNLAPVIPAHRFDENGLKVWLADAAPDFRGDLSIRQFQGGQSNPTFLIESGGKRLVLRKKPPGQLLNKAHDVEREFRVISALGPTDVPVARVVALCDDPDVIGTPFYVMEFVEGRIFDTAAMEGVEPEERRQLHLASVDALARLHAVDVEAVGLGDFGRKGGYVARQVERWSRQYQSSLSAGELPALTWLADWLREHQGVPDETTIAHGDFRHGNLCFAVDEPTVSAIFDWELSTLGHPLSDLAYLCMSYRIDAGVPHSRGILGLDLAELGIPKEEEIVERYCMAMGRSGIPDWNVFLALSFFRLSAILHGVMARALQGNASDANARQVAQRAGLLADIGQAIARQH
ncbi:MAG: aminoglycoside phosphotransferase [Microvirga sp.]|nr:aminoglycoside phosphotransferase [Microvirga sp.]